MYNLRSLPLQGIDECVLSCFQGMGTDEDGLSYGVIHEMIETEIDVHFGELESSLIYLFESGLVRESTSREYTPDGELTLEDGYYPITLYQITRAGEAKLAELENL